MRLKGALAGSDQETAVRSIGHAHLPTLALMLAGCLSLAFPLPTHAGEDGYRLLELDGHKVKWGERRLGVGANVSYAFAEEALRFDDARNCGDLAPIDGLLGKNLSMETLAREAAAAFRVWEGAADLSFHQVDDARDADIILGAQGQPRGWAFANVSYAPDPEKGMRVSHAADPEAGLRSIEQALVCLNPDRAWKVGFDGNMEIYDIRHTLIHEIGHALGLDHPGRSGQIMAYTYTEAFDDLQPGDLRGIQRLYGRAADDGGPRHVSDIHLTEKRAEDEEMMFISDAVVDQDGSIVPITGVDGLLGIGKN